MKVRYVGIETAEPLTMDELRNMAKKKACCCMGCVSG